MRIQRISAVTLFVTDMKKSCQFYGQIPGFKITYGGQNSNFTTFSTLDEQIAINLESRKDSGKKFTEPPYLHNRIIFHVSDTDEFYNYIISNTLIKELGKIENRPHDAPWGERFFHIRDPDNYQLSFAKPI